MYSTLEWLVWIREYWVKGLFLFSSIPSFLFMLMKKLYDAYSGGYKYVGDLNSVQGVIKGLLAFENGEQSKLCWFRTMARVLSSTCLKLWSAWAIRRPGKFVRKTLAIPPDGSGTVFPAEGPWDNRWPAFGLCWGHASSCPTEKISVSLAVKWKPRLDLLSHVVTRIRCYTMIRGLVNCESACSSVVTDILWSWRSQDVSSYQTPGDLKVLELWEVLDF